MRKLIGKVRAMFRRKPKRPVMRSRYRPHRLMQPADWRRYMRRWRRDRMVLSGRDHVTHYHAAGEDRYLCGKPYEREFQSVGTDRAAASTKELSCNRCQVIHNKLMQTKEGRKRLGIDTRVGAALPA